MVEIRRAIDGCERFLIVASDHSLASEVCLRVLAHAQSRCKRIARVFLSRIHFRASPKVLRKLQWIRCYDEREFRRALEEVCAALETDLESIREQRPGRSLLVATSDGRLRAQPMPGCGEASLDPIGTHEDGNVCACCV